MCVCMHVQVHVCVCGGVGVAVEFREQTSSVIPQGPFIVVVDTGALSHWPGTHQAGYAGCPVTLKDHVCFLLLGAGIALPCHVF